jgi:hypothetical protein
MSTSMSRWAKPALTAASLIALVVAPLAFILGFLGGAIFFVAFHLALFEFSKPLFRAVFSTFVEYFDIKKDGELYLRRFYLMPRIHGIRRYFLHEILRSDNDRDPHNHPWPFRTKILAGSYIEHIWFPTLWPDEIDDILASDFRIYQVDKREFGRLALPGTVLDNPSTHTHKVEIVEPVWSLFAAGEREREWGFWKMGEDLDYDSWTDHTTYLALPGHGEEERNGT